MEHRRDLEEILFSGLPEDQQQQTANRMRQATADKLEHLRSTDYDAPLPRLFNRRGRRPDM